MGWLEISAGHILGLGLGVPLALCLVYLILKSWINTWLPRLIEKMFEDES